MPLLVVVVAAATMAAAAAMVVVLVVVVFVLFKKLEHTLNHSGTGTRSILPKQFDAVTVLTLRGRDLSAVHPALDYKPGWIQKRYGCGGGAKVLCLARTVLQ